jgi:CRP-like cAMP-binding protein
MPNTPADFSILPILKKIPVLADLNEDDHREVIKKIELQYFPAHQVVFKEGDPGDAVYIIKRGVVRIYKPGSDPVLDEEVSMLGDNDFFGEMAIISEKPRNASAQTMEESEVFVLKKDDFIELVSSNPNMASRISSEFLKRFKINLQAKQA